MVTPARARLHSPAPMTERRSTLGIVAPGAAMIAVTFGLARYGYGLLLPEMRADLGVSAGTAGLIASGAYASYLAGNILVVWLLGRCGPRVPIALAALVAAAGMGLLGIAQDVSFLAAGVLMAGSAAGLAFPPYADIVARSVVPPRQSLAWSAISSGTGWGVALAGPAAILLGDQWRTVWLLFAALSLLVGLVAVIAAPQKGTSSAQGPRLQWSWFVCPRSGPLLASAVLVGTGSSVWWAFSVDAMRAAGVAQDSARVVYALCGAAGVLASVTGAATNRVGVRGVHVLSGVIVMASLGCLAFGAASAWVAAMAAVLFGVSYNSVIATQGLWSADVFAERPSAGLAAVNTALTLGTITGPLAAGMVIDTVGYRPALLLAAATLAIGVVLKPPRPQAPSKTNLAADRDRSSARP
jgi:predicted MFS family arabinose efflux permease